MSVVKPKFTFLEMQIECVFAPAVKLFQSVFGKGPEAFDAIDVVFAIKQIHWLHGERDGVFHSPDRPGRRRRANRRCG